MTRTRKIDFIFAGIFACLTIAFILLMMFSSTFFDWAWERHHNVLSWYIRTIMMVPFMFFAYRKSFAGMSFSVFALATSMAWFPKPDVVSDEVIAFLAMEFDYLTQDITPMFIALWLVVVAVFVLTAMAFWQRNFLYGGLVLIVAIITKIAWSVIEGGDDSGTLIQAAIFGLVVSLVLIYLGYRKVKRH